MKVRIQQLHPDAVIPAYAHGSAEDAGMDLCAVKDVELPPRKPTLVPTGLRIELPPGFEGQVRPRSGLALRHAVTMANAPGTIDPGYRGEVGVVLLNHGEAAYQVRKGDRVAQLVVTRYEAVEWEEGPLAGSMRGEGGFGSSGR